MKNIIHAQEATYKLILDYLICEIRTALRMIDKNSPAFYIITDTLKNINDLKKELPSEK